MMAWLILLLMTVTAFAADGFNLEQVNVNCNASISCEQRTTRFKTLKGEYRSLVHLKDTLEILASDGGYQTFTYELDETEGKHTLNISFTLKPTISEIQIGFTDRNIEYDPIQLLTIREGDFFETQKLKEDMAGLHEKLDAMGFPSNTEAFEVIEKEGKVSINVVITLGTPRIFKSITSNSKSLFIKSYLKRKFLNMYNKPFDLTKFKSYLDDAQKELFNYGYYLIGLNFEPIYKKNRVTLNISVTNEEMYAFDLRNLNREHRDVIHSLLVDLLHKYKRPLTETTIRNALREHYQKKALLKTTEKIEITQTKNQSNETVNVYRITFNENGKTRLANVSFVGNTFFSNKKLQKMFDKEAFELASVHFYDEEYFSYFQEYLKNEYVERGFVQVRVFDPVKIFDADKKVSSVEYTVSEGERAFVTKVLFEGVPEEFEDQIEPLLTNKSDKPFNPIAMDEDIKKVASYLQEKGYYYAEVASGSDSEIVTYNRNATQVTIRYKVELGPHVLLNRVLYLGNDKTKKKVLEKKVLLKKGDVITPSKTRDIEAALSATGLFNSVSVTPVRHNSKNNSTDLLVKVLERDYGLIEIAPGYRTDLGIKLTGTVTYQNIGGYNRSVTLRSQINKRTSYTTLDPARRDKQKNFIEHNTSILYNQGDIWDTMIDGAASVSYLTRRFYSFDADIFRWNGTLTRDITKNFSTSLRYQYEDIKQYNATQDINNGAFKIGSLTPGVTFDFRNSQTLPLKGAFFNLSSEWANPYFGSQKDTNLTINYYKLLSRNRFYIPYKNGTLAISLTGGIQENLARDKEEVNNVTQTQGYIPTIKVFRLTGMDIIRGFTDEEMNRLPNGQDISQVRVDNRAYMGLIKIEPRYLINDSLMTGLFYDAGAVAVNSFSSADLRDSVGITFKIVTPVGTLDFDYGIKLLRKRTPSGNLEDPGRFHVSIGFF